MDTKEIRARLASRIERIIENFAPFQNGKDKYGELHEFSVALFVEIRECLNRPDYFKKSLHNWIYSIAVSLQVMNQNIDDFAYLSDLKEELVSLEAEADALEAEANAQTTNTCGELG